MSNRNCRTNVPPVTQNYDPRLCDMIRVLAAVLINRGKYLICQRPSHKRHGGLWEFPGGKIEKNETQFEAARRELDEELGLVVTDVGEALYRAKDPGSEYIIEFVDVVASGEPELREHQAIKCCEVEELKEMNLAPTDARFVREYLCHTAKY